MNVHTRVEQLENTTKELVTFINSMLVDETISCPCCRRESKKMIEKATSILELPVARDLTI